MFPNGSFCLASFLSQSYNLISLYCGMLSNLIFVLFLPSLLSCSQWMDWPTTNYRADFKLIIMYFNFISTFNHTRYYKYSQHVFFTLFYILIFSLFPPFLLFICFIHFLKKLLKFPLVAMLLTNSLQTQEDACIILCNYSENLQKEMGGAKLNIKWN